MIGKCIWFDVKKGFGFLQADDGGPDIFVHYSKILTEPGEFKLLRENDVVEFETFEADRGRHGNAVQARNVRLIEGSAH